MGRSETNLDEAMNWFLDVDQNEVVKTEALLKSYATARAMYDLRLSQGWSQSKVAEAAGISTPRISRLLKGPGNWTMGTLAVVIHALEAKLVIDAIPFEDLRSGNGFDAKDDVPLPRARESHGYSAETEHNKMLELQKW